LKKLKKLRKESQCFGIIFQKKNETGFKLNKFQLLEKPKKKSFIELNSRIFLLLNKSMKIIGKNN
jgi:hypothetical protein